jgi:hypothetical protein
VSFENARIVKKSASNEEYRKQEFSRGDPRYRVSRSDLCAIAECPHKWFVGAPEDDTASTQWGTLIDALLLGGELNIAVTPETYDDDKGNKKPWNWNATVCRQWRETNEGRIIVKPDMLEKAQSAVKRIRDDTTIAAAINNADFQVWIEAEWKKIPVKGLIDIVPLASCALADFKTTATAAIRPYGRSIYNFGYHVQAALYLDLWNATKGVQRDSFLHVIQESSEPYEIGRRMLDSDWITLGRGIYKSALELYAQCLRSNVWPSYDDKDSPGVTRIDGWTVTSPEPWMIMNADCKLDNREGILGDFKP